MFDARLRASPILRLFVALFAVSFVNHTVAGTKSDTNGFRAALLNAEMVTEAGLQELQNSGYTAVVVMLGTADKPSIVVDGQAAERIRKAGLELCYWIEVARCPELANEHPMWMASLQGHAEWRRLHRETPQPDPDEVIKVYPWTPVLYREAFNAHLGRIARLLADRPTATKVFLNDLQGAPSACGCGNPVCRWTTDYGPIVTATRLGDDAAAKFVVEVERLVPAGTSVIPVWTTECEEHDKSNDALCAGVDCYKGICWKAYSRQLKSLAAEADTVGVLLLYKEFGQDGPHFKHPAGWICHALNHGFAKQPENNDGTHVEASRLIAVLQGWDVNDAEIQAQIDQARSAGTAGFIVARAKIDQSWQPRLMKWRSVERPSK